MNLKQLIRASRPISWLIGKQFKPSLDDIEIDVTFSCNLGCYNCDRSCAQAPSDDYITINQIQKFLNETINLNKKWNRIRICGGEPFLHSNLNVILQLLRDYKNNFSPETKLEITTNGYGSEVVEKVQNVSPDFIINNTNKTGKFQKKFEPFNLAPKDEKSNLLTDYRNCCWIAKDCGIGLNKFGYYLCGVGGGIDRVTGFDIGLKKIPLERTSLYNQAKCLCELCGHFNFRVFRPLETREPVNGEPKSKSWIEFYRLYSEKKPNLSIY